MVLSQHCFLFRTILLFSRKYSFKFYLQNFQTDWVESSTNSSIIIHNSCYIDYTLFCQNVPDPLPQPPALFPQKCASTLQPSTFQVIPPHPPYLLLQKCTPPLHISFVNDPHPLLTVLLKGWVVNPPPHSYVRDYAPLLSALLPRKFYPPLQPSNVPAPLPQI